ncbi:type II CAAX endopeptidase family protein [Flavihumibacter fluvii]|uniref:type II CAAX endopeptidase family protein n=1 Tax=Flavihumibacter fluvii TaxID=2838157 RepID=UPI001BDEA006|nr:type II CAAX endopeptidase family protein [Flavihumibacter fluvii]ULQ52283.1 CPBP family intramembrane metalloprotease [Flavihumibacter fluvii]
MTKYLKYKPAWIQLVIFGSLTFGFYLCFGLLAFFGIAKFHNLSPEQLQATNFNDPAVLAALKVVLAVMTIVIFLLPALVFAYLSDKRPLQYIGLKKPAPVNFWWLGALMMLLAFPLASWLNQINQNLHLPSFLKSTEDALRTAEANANELMAAMLDMRNPLDLVAMLFVVALLPAICEELFFRGVLQRLFIQIFQRPWTGIIITAILFSAFHGQFLGFFPRVFLGIVLGAIYWYSGSIWPAIVAHFINNAIQVVYVYKDKSYINNEPDVQPILVIFSALLVVGIAWYMRRISQTHYGELYDTDDELILPSRDEEGKEK